MRNVLIVPVNYYWDVSAVISDWHSSQKGSSNGPWSLVWGFLLDHDSFLWANLQSVCEDHSSQCMLG